MLFLMWGAGISVAPTEIYGIARNAAFIPRRRRAMAITRRKRAAYVPRRKRADVSE